MSPHDPSPFTPEDAKLMANFRHLVRQFFVFSETTAKAEGISAQNHRALLAIKVSDGKPTLAELADALVIKHHSAVELVNRLVRAGLVARKHDKSDHRRVTIELTALGENKVSTISSRNRRELARLAPHLKDVLTQLER